MMRPKRSRDSGRLLVTPDLLEVEQQVHHRDVVPRRAARPDVAEHLRVPAGEVLRAERGHRAGAHPGDRGGVDDRVGGAGLGTDEQQGGELGRQAVLVVAAEVPQDLDADGANRADVALENVEDVLRPVQRDVVLRRKQDVLAAVGLQARLDRREHVREAQLERVDVFLGEKQDFDGGHGTRSSLDVGPAVRSLRPFRGRAAGAQCTSRLSRFGKGRSHGLGRAPSLPEIRVSRRGRGALHREHRLVGVGRQDREPGDEQRFACPDEVSIERTRGRAPRESTRRSPRRHRRRSRTAVPEPLRYGAPPRVRSAPRDDGGHAAPR